MFDLFIETVVAVIIALVVLFLIWLGAFFVHIVRDEIAMEDKQKYSPKLVLGTKVLPAPSPAQA